MYEATATMPDGSVLNVSGTIREVAEWADSIISINGSCEIRIENKGDQDDGK